MPEGTDFLLHLDEPREQFRTGRRRLRGWIAAEQAVSEFRLSSYPGNFLELEERPDVRRAFPNLPFAIGFLGQVTARDVQTGSLEFSFVLGGASRQTRAHLSPPPKRPPFVRRCRASLQRLIALTRLSLAQEPDTRWNAALRAFLLEVEVARGSAFGRPEADRLIALFGKYYPAAFVVQIGANDGLSGDPLVEMFAQTRWSGLLIEPVASIAATLAERYRGRPEIHIEQVAISSQEGTAPIYRLRTEAGKMPEWFSHLATLDREVLLKHRSSIPNIDALLVEERTPTMRLQTLLDRHDIARIDLLVIDTEGHDFEILRDVNFSRYKPKVVMFEHQHLSPVDKIAAYALLNERGYICKETAEGDAIAWSVT